MIGVSNRRGAVFEVGIGVVAAIHHDAAEGQMNEVRALEIGARPIIAEGRQRAVTSCGNRAPSDARSSPNAGFSAPQLARAEHRRRPAGGADPRTREAATDRARRISWAGR